MKYWLAPYSMQDHDGGIRAWTPPAGWLGAIDLRSIPDHAVEGRCICVSADDVTLSDSDLLGQGALDEIRLSPRARAAWIAATKVVAPGTETLLDILWQTLTAAADPIGDDRAKPILPGARGFLSMPIAGTMIYRKRFALGDPEAVPVIDLLQREYRQVREDARAGRTTDPELHRKVLDYWGEKFGLRDPQDVFIPGDLPKETRLKHSTTITESFNTGNSTTLGPDLSWTELGGNLQVLSNQCANVSVGTTANLGRADSDLSSVDHYSQCSVHSWNVARGSGPIARKDSSATVTCYLSWVSGTGPTLTQYKIISGGFTALSSGSALTASAGDVIQLECDGSSISSYQDAVLREGPDTDTAITTGTRCGVRIYNNDSGTFPVDAFEASDLAAGSVSPVYFQHRRMQSLLAR